MKDKTPVVVTTKHRGVFFGYLEGKPTDAETCRLERARMCVYWSQKLKGVMGLAATGPLDDCKIGPAVPAIVLRDITAIIETTKEAAKRWEDAPWKM